jgi:Ca2+-binding RTX toxin-like protein
MARLPVKTIVGTELDDLLFGTAGNDKIYGRGGNDLITGSLGNDYMDGGSGIDTVTYSSAASAVIVDLSVTSSQNTGASGFDTLISIENLVGGAFNDTLKGNSLANSLSGLGGNDTLDGRAGNDILNGGAGNDTLLGGSGNDIFLEEGLSNGNDSIDGGLGIDTLDYSGVIFDAAATAGVTVDLRLTAAQNTVAAGIDRIVNVENIIGSASNDTIYGSEAANALSGGAGNDILMGNGGDDVLNGGAGNDLVNGGAGNDIINAGRGSPAIIETDFLTGGLGADRFVFDNPYASAAFGMGGHLIEDFSTLEGDKVDIRGVFAPGASVTFTSGFVLTGVAGEVLIRQTFTEFGMPGVNQLIRIDIDGNGTADVGFQVASNVLLTANDFII